MLTHTLKKLFRRDLEKLKQEIGLYQKEKNLWIVDKNIPNSAGNLCLHLVGNLNYFIGTHLGNTGYVRHRELEFSLKDIPQAELIKMVEETIEVIDTTLDHVTEAQLNDDYPVVVFADKMTTEYFLVHLAAHLGYHLGQVNYHRRLLDF